jgi:aminoglycoside phosphotransferase family enzyme/predicted kinase
MDASSSGAGATPEQIARFILGMSRPSAYPHAVGSVEQLETHISWVFLAGKYAYKVKKPVALGFLDFSTLESRRFFCEEELRINRRLAPELYLDVVAIRRSAEAPHVDGPGDVIEYAVRMRRFPQAALASTLLAHGGLTREAITEFATCLADFHAALPPAPADNSYGAPATVLHAAIANLENMDMLLGPGGDRMLLRALRRWTENEFGRRQGVFRDRHVNGMTQECHGDLHLRNILEWNGRLVAFDGIEFDPALRWIDSMNDAAFLFMDLLDRGADPFAWRFLSAYLEATGDYGGLALLRFYVVYRALVRAKVHLIRSRQAGISGADAARLSAQFHGYLQLASRCASERQPALLLMHGFSGSGKSVLALELAEHLGAIRVRSDVERKRLHGLAPLQSSKSACGEGIYSADASQEIYEKLTQVAHAVVASGYRAIIDACSLKCAHRRPFAGLAGSLGVPLVIVDVRAPLKVLRTRIGTRAADASEATLEVLEHQLATSEPIATEEHIAVVACEGCDAPPQLAAQLAPRIAAAWHGQSSGR